MIMHWLCSTQRSVNCSNVIALDSDTPSPLGSPPDPDTVTMLDMIGANAGGKGDDGQDTADKLEVDSHAHWVNPFRNSVGPHGKVPAKGVAGAAFWKQPRRWLHVDLNGKTSYVTVRFIHRQNVTAARLVEHGI